MMRYLLVLLAVVLFISCEQKDATPAIDYSLLEKYNWRAIYNHSEKFPMDTTQTITYADTMIYSFTAKKFVFHRQDTKISYILSSEDTPRYKLKKQDGTLSGNYTIDKTDSMLIFIYQTVTGDLPEWNIPGKDTTIKDTFEIIRLNKSQLQLKNRVPGFPSPGQIKKYTSIPK